MHPNATFIDRAAVEAWDAWFRRRDGARLRDTTIEATWRRVADAIAGDAATGLHEELLAALASWRLLPDERILATAGTAEAEWPVDACALVNAAVLVREPGTTRARFDRARCVETAGLALRVLDAALAQAPRGAMLRPRVGVTGVADALALLGLRYAGADAHAFVRELGRALAEGCLAADVALAREHGARVAFTQALRARACGRGLPATLVAEAAQHGLRHAQVLALGAHPRLALLANNIADALDPLHGPQHAHAFPPDGRRVCSDGYARTIAAAARREPGIVDTLERMPPLAQLALRGALQPWLDAPIVQPLRVARLPGGDERARVCDEAALLGLGEVTWTLADGAEAATSAATPKPAGAD